MERQDREPEFVVLMSVIEQAIDHGLEHYSKDAPGTESGFMAWVVAQELRRAGYKITRPGTDFSYPDDSAH